MHWFIVEQGTTNLKTYLRNIYSISGFYPSNFLQLVSNSKNSFLNWVLKLNFFISFQIFFCVCIFFILLHHCFYSCKPQICAKQTGLTFRFVIPQKISAAAFKKLKTNMVVVQMLLFCFCICKCCLQWTHSQRSIYCEMKEEITSQKKLFTVKKKTKNMTPKDKRSLVLLCFTDFEQVFVAWVVLFIFSLLNY